MPRTAQVDVYQFGELSESAKERARQWYREGMHLDQWWDATYEDAIQCAEILGITIKYRTYHVVGGKTERTGQEPCIWFSGFSSQGDGACFEGTYAYAKGCARNIRRHAPPSYTDKDGVVHKQEMNERLAKIADGLVALQKRYRYSIEATVRQSGHCSHEYCTEIDVGLNYPNGNVINDITLDDEKTLAELLRDFMRWIYRQLEAEHDYLNSDEQVDESILANEYEFDEDGERWRE